MEVDPLEVEIDEKEQNPMPEYINSERKSREAFLSQVGNFTTEERGLFHLLCDNWDHEIGYAKFVTTVNKKHPIDEKYLKSLMGKLRTSGCGILMTKYVRGERGVDKIILTDIRTNYFYYYFINNEYQKNYEEVSNDFVNDSNFDKYEISTADLNPLTLDIELVNKIFIKNELNKMNVYMINIEGFKSFYATSETLQDLLKISVRKIRYYFKSDNFIAFIAKLLNSSISKIRSSINKFEISTWKSLTFEIIKNNKIINGKFKNISLSFFKAVVLVNKYCISELEQKDLDLENEKKLKQTLKEISAKIRDKEFSPFSQESFNSLFDEYNNDAPEIKSEFYEQYVDNKTKTGLTEIVYIGQCYIHQDNLYKVFLDQIGLASVQLHEFYVMEFKTCLVSNSSDASLLEGFPFESNILSKLQEEFLIIHDLLNRKGVLAEAVIHFCKKRGHSQGKMHNLLSMYFIEGTNELRNISSIFNLDIIEIFEKAYSTLSTFKRFFIFIFGQYPKYVERFTGHRRTKKNHDRKNKSSDSSGNSQPSSYTPLSSEYSSRGKSVIKKEQAVKRRGDYNKEQIENAWDNLGNELTKKKRT